MHLVMLFEQSHISELGLTHITLRHTVTLNGADSKTDRGMPSQLFTTDKHLMKKASILKNAEFVSETCHHVEIQGSVEILCGMPICSFCPCIVFSNPLREYRLLGTHPNPKSTSCMTCTINNSLSDNKRLLTSGVGNVFPPSLPPQKKS